MAAHPTIGDMVKHPYGVVENYVDPDGQIYDGVYATAVNSFVPSFEYHFDNLLGGFLLKAAASERGKEIQYICKMMEIFNQNNNLRNSVLYQNFLQIYNSILSIGLNDGISAMQLSFMVDTLQKMQLGLYELDKEVQENFEIYRNINTAFLDRNIIEELRKVLAFTGAASSIKLGTLNLDMTGTEFIEEVLKGVKKKMLDAVNNSNITKTSEQGKEVLNRYIQNIDEIINLYRIKLGQFYSNKFEAIGDAETIKGMKLNELEQAAILNDANAKFKKDKILINKEGKPKTFHRTIIDAILGSLGGKSVEYLLDIRGGGMNTGNIAGKGGQSIDADNIQLGSGTLEYYLDYNRDKDKWDGITTYDEFKRELEAIQDFKSKFIIMTSAKDQSVSKEFKNSIAHTDVKIKGTASLEKRAPEIIEMYNLIDHPGAMDPTDLIFSIANLAEEFVCNGQVEQAKQTLGAICVGWMFDDVEKIVKGGSLLKNTSEIHLYNINNYFYTLSDILYQTAYALNSKNVADQSSYVKVGISLPKSKIFAPMVENNSPEDGMPRWNKVSETLMSGIGIDIHMNPKNLFNALFGGVFGSI